jgi:flagellar basal-body rod modification protein FlgD
MDMAPTTLGAQSAPSAGTSDARSDARTKGATAITSDFETFLKMLTTQMENQDPLNPIASEDLAVQLATFSGVEQQVLTNDLLQGIAAALDQAAPQNLSRWIGMDVRAVGATAFDGAPLTLFGEAAAGADSAVLVVRDAAEREVQRLHVPPGDEQIIWAGVGENGAPLPPGVYSFELESYKGEELAAVTPVETYHRIIEARREEEGIVLVTRGGGSISSEEVTAVRAPEGS